MITWNSLAFLINRDGRNSLRFMVKCMEVSEDHVEYFMEPCRLGDYLFERGVDSQKSLYSEIVSVTCHDDACIGVSCFEMMQVHR